jgi:hypothetical protein
MIELRVTRRLAAIYQEYMRSANSLDLIKTSSSSVGALLGLSFYNGAIIRCGVFRNMLDKAQDSSSDLLTYADLLANYGSDANVIYRRAGKKPSWKIFNTLFNKLDIYL